MKQPRSYKIEDTTYQDFQEICKIQSQEGKGKVTPAYLIEQYANDYVKKYKYLLEGRKNA